MPEARLYHHPNHAVLGDRMLEITDPVAPKPLLPLPPLPARRDHDDLVDRLDAVVSELEGLRADLASRTLAARLTRLWAWLRRLW